MMISIQLPEKVSEEVSGNLRLVCSMADILFDYTFLLAG